MISRRKTTLAGAVVALSVCLAGTPHTWAAGKASKSKPHANVSMKASASSFVFAPKKKSIKVGTKVTWVNHSSAPHNVTSYNMKKFKVKSSTLMQGKSFSFTFHSTGTFKYHCTFHPGMVGQLIIKK
jgi:plastocyanin